MRALLKPPRNRKQDTLPIQEDHRAQFFEDYRKEAEEYDREFIKSYDEDLNTTLIFVSLACCSSVRVLTWMTGWSVFCCDCSVHHPSPPPAPIRPKSRDNRSSPGSYPQDRQHHLWKPRPRSTSMDWSPPNDNPSPSHPLHKSHHIPLLHISRDAR